MTVRGVLILVKRLDSRGMSTSSNSKSERLAVEKIASFLRPLRVSWEIMQKQRRSLETNRWSKVEIVLITVRSAEIGHRSNE